MNLEETAENVKELAEKLQGIGIRIADLCELVLLKREVNTSEVVEFSTEKKLKFIQQIKIYTQNLVAVEKQLEALVEAQP